jgi:hypothetical protein
MSALYRKYFHKSDSFDDVINTLLKSSPEVPIGGEIEVECRIKYNRPLWVQSLIPRLSSGVTPEETRDVVVSKGNLRKIIADDGTTSYQRKTKVSKTDTVDTDFVIAYNPRVQVPVRFAKSVEAPVREVEFNAAVGPITTRKRTRLSYPFENFHIDITHVVYKETDTVENQVEVEFNPAWMKKASIGDFIGLFFKAFTILFPDVHSPLTVKTADEEMSEVPSSQAADAATKREGESRPVNIQLEKHFNQNINSYAATNKLDGVAYYLWADARDKGQRLLLFNEKDIWVVHLGRKLFTESWICKAEVVTKKDNLGVTIGCQLWLFDAIWTASGGDLYDNSLMSRLEVCERVKDQLTAIEPFNKSETTGWWIFVKKFFIFVNEERPFGKSLC